MSDKSQDMAPTMYPYFGYRDSAAALKWLAEAFGFEKTAEIAGPDGKLMHAEMTFGNGAIMLGTSSGEHGSKVPAEHGIYIYVDDVEAHYERAKAAGAQIVYPPEETEWGDKALSGAGPGRLRVELWDV